MFLFSIRDVLWLMVVVGWRADGGFSFDARLPQPDWRNRIERLPRT